MDRFGRAVIVIARWVPRHFLWQARRYGQFILGSDCFNGLATVVLLSGVEEERSFSWLNSAALNRVAGGEASHNITHLTKILANFSGTWNDFVSGPSGENAVVSTSPLLERLR